MTALRQAGISAVLTEDVNQVRKNWGWFFAAGLLQIAVGMLAVSFAFSATLATTIMLGILLLIAGGAQMTAAFLSRSWGGFFLFLLLGVLYSVAGLLTIQQPLAMAEGLTLMLAAALLIGGTFRVIVALAEQFPSWGWVLLNGVVTVVLGIAIWRQWPGSGLWVLGLFAGIDLIMNGVTWSVLAAAVRRGLAQTTST